ncbi:MAG: tetratricopeptide repeat protein [Bdellovibrio sp.]|nr:tetratricopeptide repeat protein [Bdellovibrio sp.]
MQKFRVKVNNSRVVGPFSKEQIAELFLKKHIKSEDLCQIFPTGEWLPLRAHRDLCDFIESAKKNPLLIKHEGDSKTVVNLAARKVSRPPEAKQEKTQDEIVIEKTPNKAISVEDLEVLDPDVKNEGFEEFKFEKKTQKFSISEAMKKEEATEQAINPGVGLDKTIIAKGQKKEANLDKTIVRPENLARKLQEQAAQKEAATKTEQENPEKAESTNLPTIATEKEIDIYAEATSVSNVSDYLEELKKNIVQTEQDFAQEQQRLIDEVNKDTSEEKLETESENKELPKQKKAMKPVIALVFIVLIYFLFFEEEEQSKSYEPLAIKITFPVVLEVENDLVSTEEMEKGKAFATQNSYMAKINAINHLQLSLANKFKDNPSFGLLLLLYAELLPNAGNQQEALKTIYRMLKIVSARTLADVNMALGAALYYYHQGRYKTAKNTIENFRRVTKGLTPKFLAIWMEICIKAGDFVTAKELLDKLSSVKPKTLDIYLALSHFYQQDSQPEKALEILQEGSKVHKGSVALLLEYAKLKLEAGDFKQFSAALRTINDLKAEYSPVYFSKYMEYMGILNAKQGKMEEATKYFKLALKVMDTEELRSKLASLEVGGTSSVQSLILESKILFLMNKAKFEIEKKNWDQAMAYAISASDLSETYLPSKLLLAEIQIQRGYFDFALKKLLDLQKIAPMNTKVNHLLLYAYIESFKIDDAQKEIQQMLRTPFSKTYEYASLLGLFYKKQNNTPLAIRWYQESINRNPLNDKDYFHLAEILVYMKKFKDGSRMLAESLALDPDNVDYVALNAEILYEEKGADTAIGYLREQLEKHLEDPKLIGEIAKYYYRSGQTKFFDQYKEKMESLVNKDAGFYLFLIDASRKEDKFEEVVAYSKELLKIDPGNLATRMQLSEFFLDNGKTEDALREFEQVNARLPSYPKVHYYLAKVYILMKNLEKAQQNAEEEIKNNPNLEFGYSILGQIYREKNDWPNAIKNYEAAVTKNGKSVEAMAGMAWIKDKQNNHSVARELYMRAIKEEPGNAKLHKELAFVYKNMGQSGLAVESFQVYLSLVPNATDRSNIEAEIKNLQ